MHDEHIRRLHAVCYELPAFIKPLRIDLIETLFSWAFSELASHPQRDECEAEFCSHVDLLYAQTYDAEKSLTETERQQLIVTSRSVNERLAPIVEGIYQESAGIITAYGVNDLNFQVGKAINHVRCGFMQHSSDPLFYDLIGQCFLMCGAIVGNREGACTSDKLVEHQEKFVSAISGVSDWVLAAIESGKLIVVDGKIVDPDEDDFDDEDDLEI